MHTWKIHSCHHKHMSLFCARHSSGIYACAQSIDCASPFRRSVYTVLDGIAVEKAADFKIFYQRKDSNSL